MNIASAAKQAPAGKHFIWRIDSPSTSTYLVGSIHMLRQDVFPLAPEIENAFAASDILVLEADVFGESNEEVMKKVMDYATYLEGQTLKNQLSEEDYLELTSILLEAGIPSQTVQQYRPWYISIMVEQILMSRLGLHPEYGVDYYFRAKAGQREVKELESLEEQLDLLAGFTDQDQLLMMRWSMEDLEHEAEDFEEFLHAWQTGDVQVMEKELQKEIQDDPRFQPIWNRMIIDRNPAIADHILGYMGTNKRHFVVVGAAHLIGPQGVVAILQKRGYKIQQL